VGTVKYIRTNQSDPLTIETVVGTIMFLIYSLYYIMNIDFCHALDIDPNDI